MLNRDRYLLVNERDYDGEAIEYFPLREFPYPDELEEVFPMPLELNSVKTERYQCFYNALRVAKASDTYNIVFCYIGSGESFTPHAIVEQSGIYFEVTPMSATEITQYYRYAKIGYHDYLAELRAHLGDDFDPANRHFFPISVDKDGRFVFVVDD
ncbi:hypothetical protein CN140_01635 [Sinorhizobium meliloti]|uniref:hypothetical protein n=1 Tax=Rhizobium meliloti TaxID=382 RepID=UPI000FD97A4A|nr:hypothetical protein [Sinorhizobium meliloti]RVL87658.1 hypothetical protein CN140_01635 [Sinorhizobium meliloti]